MGKPIEEMQKPQPGFTDRFVFNNSKITDKAADLIARLRKNGELQYAANGIDIKTTAIITSQENYKKIKGLQ